ncbi:hypothetical protein [Asticcacaulis sp. 201]|uniref:hypothetical protein n=1 Tax=Asticcacaulis sp. 201 TaxID=3028787 RepID=UPI0029167305|nr:hypothetical protein [Asticcacaulis sp. 201]MDV6332666.1 hypothetical protein [Asticcacaulis sp. 201]
MPTTGPSQVTKDKGAAKIRKGAASQIKRDNNRDKDRNAATHQESRDTYEREHFHAQTPPDIERSREDARDGKGQDDPETAKGGDRQYIHSDTSHHNDDSHSFQRFESSGGNREGGGRHYARYGHNANRRPDDYAEQDVADNSAYGDSYRTDRNTPPTHGEVEQQKARANAQRGDRYDGHGRYDNRDYNDRQNGWQANGRADNRDDNRYNNDWQARDWRETAQANGHPWRPNDDWRNEQRNGSELDRDRGTFGNSRFRDDDYGYRSSSQESRGYGRYDDGDRNETREPPRHPRGYTAESETDYTDRNPSRDRDHR